MNFLHVGVLVVALSCILALVVANLLARLARHGRKNSTRIEAAAKLPIFRWIWTTSWVAWTLCLVLSVGCTASVLLEDCYLNGMAATFRTLYPDPDDRVEAVLHWVVQWDRRASDPRDRQPGCFLVPDDDAVALNVMRRSTGACGARTGLMVAILNQSGIPARAFMLLDKQGLGHHISVVARLHGRWVVADPIWLPVFNSRPQHYTREELEDGRLFQAMRRSVRSRGVDYSPDYDYARWCEIRFAAVPIVGPLAGRLIGAWMNCPPERVPRPPWMCRPLCWLVLRYGLLLLVLSVCLWTSPLTRGTGRPGIAGLFPSTARAFGRSLKGLRRGAQASTRRTRHSRQPGRRASIPGLREIGEIAG